MTVNNEAPDNGAGQGGEEGSEIIPPTTPTPPENDGQGNGETITPPDNTPVPFEQRRAAFIAKKGWDPIKADEQMLESYEALESKVGNWKEVEEKARMYDEIHPKYESLSRRAEQFDSVTGRLESIKEKARLEAGEIDLKTYPTEKLANLYRNGTLGIQDLPSERQYEVQQFVKDQDATFERDIQTQAVALADRHPILKNPDVCALVANQIERGMVDPKTGKEMSPDEIVTRYERIYNMGGKQTEERIKKETERLKNGNLERAGSPVSTKAHVKTKTVAEAFRQAVAEAG